MTQFADNIRRIARGNRKKGALGIYTERDPVPGGTVFLVTNPDLLNGNAPATSNGSNSPEQQEEADEDKNKETDPNNPNTFNKGGTGTGGDSAQQEGVADVGDAIDGTAGPSMPATGGGTSGTGGLRELTGLKDCETGKEFNLHLDGNFVPPEGWDDPDTPPVLEGYEEGFYWEDLLTGFTGITYLTAPAVRYPTDGIQQSVEWLGTGRVASSTETSRNVYLDVRVTPKNGDPPYTEERGVFVVNRQNCGESVIVLDDGASACGDSLPPTTDEWPQDGTYDLAIKDGQFQTNEYDADQPDNFEPRGTIDFCYGDNKTARAEVTADGGVVYYQTDANGAPTGTARVLDSGGQLIAAGDATDSFISQYLPQ